MPKQKVGEDQTTSSLALDKGFFWKDIWEHPENAALKEKRKDPNVLFSQDDIFIPVKEKKTVDKGSEAEYVFKRKGEPSKLKMKLLELDKPRANEDYVLKVAGKLIKGTTDGDGKLEHFIPGNAKSAQLIFKDGKEVHSLTLGGLDPIELATGIIQRLNNLGYKTSSAGVKKGVLAKDAFSDPEKLDKKLVNSIKRFQADNNMEQTGKLDQNVLSLLDQKCK
jgi:N-acetylmuramoyl-L-alanine amidase